MPSNPLILSDRLHDYAAFSDESHSDGTNRYMVIGGILIRSAHAHLFSKRISDAYAPFRFPDSIQWKNINRQKLDAFKAVVDVAAEEITSKKVDFGCIIFDQSKVDHKTYSENDRERGFFKFLYQHHLKWSRHYGDQAVFRCFHGNMDTKYDLAEMLRCLNHSVKQAPPAIRRPYLQFEFASVRNMRCCQVADLLIGAAGFAANGGLDKQGTAKHELYQYMTNAFGVADFSLPTKWPDRGFHIWSFKL